MDAIQPRAGTLSAFRSRDFRLVWGGQTISLIGDAAFIVALGWRDSDALIDDLPRYVTAWNGETLEDGDFDALGLMRPDKKQIARMVVGLYETGDGLGELRRGLSAHLTSAASSVSPEA